MARASEERLRVWIYQKLMGTLGAKKEAILKEALKEKQKRVVLDPIENSVWVAMSLYNNPINQRKYLKRELKVWEQRTAP